MLKLSLLLVSAFAFVGCVAEPTDAESESTDEAREVPTDPTITPVDPPDSDDEPLGGPTYWDLPSCHSYSWMKNHGAWLCAIHDEIQIMFDPRHQNCGSLYGSFWHQCAYQI